jgi:hypothetical protein
MMDDDSGDDAATTTTTIKLCHSWSQAQLRKEEGKEHTLLKILGSAVSS